MSLHHGWALVHSWCSIINKKGCLMPIWKQILAKFAMSIYCPVPVMIIIIQDEEENN